ncbi:hypothetical protein B9Z55_025149 [Caenorhabditis nigoni]|uniref:Uncharacterized protein n=1 Tax=Caenorhabditis nigoni TaxID=1611254 RepID=A0A2G5SXU8_9PELO|nr:hypothetical protein B9Z55_025149 [Caenorhabditis nigoni]
MRLSLVVTIFTAVMIAPVVPTDFFISGTVSCQSPPPWCYTIQLLELDSISNDVFGSVSKCELTNSTQEFLFWNWHPADGLFDWHYELELLIKHDCGLEVTDEEQSLRMSFGQYHSNKRYFQKVLEIDLSKNTTEIVLSGDRD